MNNVDMKGKQKEQWFFYKHKEYGNHNFSWKEIVLHIAIKTEQV